ncbi:MAG: ABC transporter permease [Planctomycetes bacterium]|nr:ABC transporter permease [Planctomycetota bacterium]
MSEGGSISAPLGERAYGVHRTLPPVLAVFELPRILWEHRELVKAMARRSLKARFRGSVLGLLWPLIHPFCLFWIYLFVFSRIFPSRKDFFASELVLLGDVSQVLRDNYYFAVYLFSGILAWTAFGEAVHRNAQAITGNGNLIKKMAFPSEVMPLAECLATLAIQVFGTSVFLGFMFVGGLWPAPGPAQLLIWPILLVLQLVFTYGLSLIVGTLQVFLRDTDHILGVLITFWMFLTPIFWSPHIEALQGYVGYFEWNPMFHLIQAYRNVLIHPGCDWLSWEAWRPVLVFAGVGLGMLWLGVWFFQSKRKRFADEI